MNFHDKVVARVHEVQQSRGIGGAVPGLTPGVRAGPRVAGHRNQVGGAGGANGGSGGIGGADPLLRGHGVGLVHQAENDMIVAFVQVCQTAPEIGEGAVGHLRAADDIAVVPRIVVRIEYYVHAFGGGLGDKAVKTSQLSAVKGLVQRALQTLPTEGQAYGVHAFGLVIVDLVLIRIDVIRCIDAGQVVFTELGAGQTHPFKRDRAGRAGTAARTAGGA